jgi:hypothetical protein
MISDKFLVTCFSGAPSENGRGVSWFSPEQTGESVVLTEGYCKNAHAFYTASLLPHIIVGMLCAIVITSVIISFYKKKLRSQFIADTDDNNGGNELRTSLLSTTHPVALAASAHDGEELPTASCHPLPVAPEDVDGMAPGSIPYSPPVSMAVVQLSDEGIGGARDVQSTPEGVPVAVASPVSPPVALASPVASPVAVASSVTTL